MHPSLLIYFKTIIFALKFIVEMNSFLLTLLAVVIILLIAVFLLGFKIFLFKDGKFPNIHIGRSKAMRDRGIHCASTQDAEAQKAKNILDFNKLIEELHEK